jgi:hypothetical protein
MGIKVLTGPARLSYETLWKPKPRYEGKEPEYSAQILIPKSDKKTYAALINAIKTITESTWPIEKNRPDFSDPEIFPIKDGDEYISKKTGKVRSECIDHWVIGSHSLSQPGIIGPDREDIIDKSEVYSGCYCRFSITLVAFDKKMNKGISVYLNNVQKLKDGDHLGGRVPAKDDFSGDDDEETVDNPFKTKEKSKVLTDAEEEALAKKETAVPDEEQEEQEPKPKSTGKTGRKSVPWA